MNIPEELENQLRLLSMLGENTIAGDLITALMEYRDGEALDPYDMLPPMAFLFRYWIKPQNFDRLFPTKKEPSL